MRTRVSLAIGGGLAAFGAISTSVNAQTVEADPTYYSFYPQAVLSLGAGFSPNDVSAPKAKCIVADQVPLEGGSHGNTALRTEFATYLVRNSEQLKSALSIDAKIDASFLSFGGGGNFSYNDTTDNSSDSITAVVSATSEFARIGLGPLKLTPEAAALLATPAKFAKTCGTRYVAIERRGASVFAILTMSHVSSESASAIRAGVNGHGGFGPVSAGGSGAFSKELTDAAKSGRLNVQLVSTGGPGLGELGPLVAAAASKEDSLAEIQKELGNYLKNFTADNSAPIGFSVASMEQVGWDEAGIDPWSDLQERKLRELVKAYRTTSDEIDEIDAIVNGGDPRAAFVDAAGKAKLTTAETALNDYETALATRHRQCKAGAGPDACKMPDPPAVDLAALPPPQRPPQLQFIVKWDGGTMSAPLSQIVMDGQPQCNLLQKVRTYQPTATSAQVVARVTGDYITAIDLEYYIDPPVGAINPTIVKVLPVTGKQTDYILQSSSSDDVPPLSCNGKLSAADYVMVPMYGAVQPAGDPSKAFAANNQMLMIMDFPHLHATGGPLDDDEYWQLNKWASMPSPTPHLVMWVLGVTDLFGAHYHYQLSSYGDLSSGHHLLPGVRTATIN